MTALAPTLQAFFTDRLMLQRGASPHTIGAYRDTMRLLLAFTAERVHRPPNRLDLADLDAPLIGAFLTHLEHDRNNSIRTRNQRLTAIRSFFTYAAMRHPEHAASIQQVLALPSKRHDRNLVTYLTDPEIDAVLNACNRTTWTGRRDRTMLLVAIQTGLRITELTGLKIGDLTLGKGANVHTIGKGRKGRCTPLRPDTITALRTWLTERTGQAGDPLFPTSTGRPLSRDAIEHRVARYITDATANCPSLGKKNVTTHTLRHTCAMRLLAAGVDITVIALWLGHEQVATTSIYLHADMSIKERALERTTPPGTSPGRYKPTDTLLAFLDTL
jgi:site-specific recombinase XerD